ncbi:MAG: hypothetical protein U0168_13590 [Nannocystaceae bacterium]
MHLGEIWVVGLPVLEIMLDRHGRALAGGGAMAKHFFVGSTARPWWRPRRSRTGPLPPRRVRREHTLKQATMPLGNYGDVRQQVSIISNLRIRTTTRVQAAGTSKFHLGAMPPLLCGRGSNLDDSSACRGITADQVVANAIGAGTSSRPGCSTTCSRRGT